MTPCSMSKTPQAMPMNAEQASITPRTTAEEIMDATQGSGVDSTPMSADEALFKELFSVTDGNDDGLVDRTEFGELLQYAVNQEAIENGGEVQPVDARAVEMLFREADSSADGYIDQAEMNDFLSSLTPGASENSDVPAQMPTTSAPSTEAMAFADSLFDTTDENSSDSMDQQEFGDLVQFALMQDANEKGIPFQPASEQAIASAFNQIDTSSDGQISRDEFSTLIDSLLQAS